MRRVVDGAILKGSGKVAFELDRPTRRHRKLAGAAKTLVAYCRPRPGFQRRRWRKRPCSRVASAASEPASSHSGPHRWLRSVRVGCPHWPAGRFVYAQNAYYVWRLGHRSGATSKCVRASHRRDTMEEHYHALGKCAVMLLGYLLLVSAAGGQERRLTFQEATDLALRQNHPIKTGQHAFAARQKKRA